ncbi:hypothetical protein DDE82_006446 [Stemphylium lycopersici]|nr:hypothetical protein DDE82_006446 [Stemphylium lycopersici]
MTDNFRVRTPSFAPRPKPSSRLTEPLPYTPTRPYYLDEPYLRSKGAPRYPYTPDSSQTLRRNTEIPASPTPWDDYSEASASPVQDALSSCIAQFEDLIQSQQPDEDQMEYIVGQFEAMATHLAAPESQAKETDASIFSSFHQDSGTTQAEDEPDDLAEAKRLYHQAYVAEVGDYVKGVQKCISDLKKRLDEVKTLNSIQLDVISDLRQQMRTVRQSMRDDLERGSEDEGGELQIAQIVDLDEPGVKHSAQVNEYDDDTNNNNDDDDDDDDDDDTSTTKEFGLDSWQTLIEGDGQDVSQEIHAEYSKLLRSTVDSLTADAPPITPTKRRLITIVRTPPKRSFWASFGEALDAVSNLLLED